jgi:thiamine kinase-like enzyme
MGKVKILDEFKGGSMARTFLVSKYGQNFVRKIAEKTIDNLGVQKLKNQWEWLFNFNKDEPGIFPEVSFLVHTKDKCYYDMEYVEMPTLRDYLLSTENIDVEVLRNMLEGGSLITVPDYNKAPNDNSYIIKNHLDKMIERTKCIVKYDFYKSDTLVINGKEYKNLHIILNEISSNKNILKLLQPDCLFRSHGDFTFQNVLTDGFETVIIDPRGEGPDSIYYDISKIFQSCHGKYDLLYNGNYEFSFNENQTNINFKILKHEEKFDRIFELVKELIPNYYVLNNNNWELITKFYEASHFISMVPFRLKENGAITIICYAIGIKLLNEFLEECNNVKFKFRK